MNEPTLLTSSNRTPNPPRCELSSPTCVRATSVPNEPIGSDFTSRTRTKIGWGRRGTLVSLVNRYSLCTVISTILILLRNRIAFYSFRPLPNVTVV